MNIGSSVIAVLQNELNFSVYNSENVTPPTKLYNNFFCRFVDKLRIYRTTVLATLERENHIYVTVFFKFYLRVKHMIL